MTRRCVPLLASLAIAAGCAHAPPGTALPAPAGKRAEIHLEPFRVAAVRRAGAASAKVEVTDAFGLFDRGGRLLAAKRYRAALAAYDRLLADFPRSKLAGAALYNAGLAHEGLRDFAAAARRYREILRRGGSADALTDAAFRLGACYAELRRYRRSAAVFRRLLARADLSVDDRIEALARKGLAEFRLGDHAAARRTFRQAIGYHRRLPASDRLDQDFFLAMVHYYLAAIPHVDFRNLRPRLGPTLARDLDEKARLLLEAQAGYIAAIRVHNPYWATAAGFQIGSLYREFYTTLMTAVPDFKAAARKLSRRAKIPVPKARRQLVRVYLEEVHKRVRVLLGKAMRVFERNVVMAERVGVESGWVKKSRAQMAELREILAATPREALDRLPPPGRHPEDEEPPAARRGGASPPARSGETPGRVDPATAEEAPGRVVL